MYRFTEDRRSGVYLCELSWGGDADTDFRAHVTNLRAAAAARPADIERLAMCVMLRLGHPVPNALWRAEVAGLMNSGEMRASMAVVTNNPVVRGVLTALSWTVKGDAVRFKPFFGGVEDAHAWLAAERGQPLPSLKALHAEFERARANA
jgi:hypothetical protein